jgi:hypothetical protein
MPTAIGFRSRVWRVDRLQQLVEKQDEKDEREVGNETAHDAEAQRRDRGRDVIRGAEQIPVESIPVPP